MRKHMKKILFSFLFVSFLLNLYQIQLFKNLSEQKEISDREVSLLKNDIRVLFNIHKNIGMKYDDYFNNIPNHSNVFFSPMTNDNCEIILNSFRLSFSNDSLVTNIWYTFNGQQTRIDIN